MTVYIPESPGDGGRLGRHVNHDVRSFGFPFRPAAPLELADIEWERTEPIFDQDGLGSCVGNAICGALATGPVHAGLPVGHIALDEAEAVKLYHEATLIDPWPGSYPPDDTGTDGVSGAKAAKNDGLISGYTHCFSLDDALAALMEGPVAFGINWYSSFDTPSPDGIVTITRNAYVRGGHEVLGRGLRAAAGMILIDNSWGQSWGPMGGSFLVPFEVMTRLLAEQGDATVPLPLSQPAPVPVPVIWTADGTTSLLSLSARRSSPASTILRTTLQHYKAFTSAMSHYIQGGDLRVPVPAGERLCLAWPQYQIR
jgi:hypothetical protein